MTPSGKVRYSRTSAQTPVWVTAQALAALARKPFPLAPGAAREDDREAGRDAQPRRRPPRRGQAPAASHAHAAEGHRAALVHRHSRTARSARRHPPDLAPTLQDAARAAGYLTGALVAPVA